MIQPRLFALRSLWFVFALIPVVSVAESTSHPAPWKFVSIPDFLNNDVDYPEPRWDDALDYVLQAIQAEEPDFVLVAGDLVMGRWSHSREHLEKMAARYYPAWKNRMAAYGLNYYVALGDHEIGDDPWEGEKKDLVPHYKQAFRDYLDMPAGGPPGFEQTTFAVRHKNVLLVAVDEFEQDAEGQVHVRVGEAQQHWLRETMDQHGGVTHRVVMGHVPILPGWRWRSSSRFSMPGRAESPLWKLMAAEGVDLYLCGEVHDISLAECEGVLQVVHGSQPSNVPEFNYLVVDVFDNRMDLTLKSIATVREGPRGKELDPFKVDPYTKTSYRIPDAVKRQGFRTVGTMTVDKAAAGRTLFDRRTGFCLTRYEDQNGTLTNGKIAAGTGAVGRRTAEADQRDSDDVPSEDLKATKFWQQHLRQGRRQLFLDDEVIESLDGVTRQLHQATKYDGNPVVRVDQTPWQQYRAQLYGTVLYDPQDQLFKMWYLSGARLPFEDPIMVDGKRRIPNFQLVGYGESPDGFDWKLPNLGLVDFNGSKENNICRIARTNAEGIAVLKDPVDPDPQRRYKAFYWEHNSSRRDIPDISVNGMSVSFSADGKLWRDHPENPVIALGSDSGQQALWDPYLGKYVVFGRFGAGGRKVARAESDDFVHWSQPQLVFQADAQDGARTQVYGMGISLYEGIYIGLPWMFYEGTSWKIDVQLAMSRDGVNWSRIARGQRLIPNGEEGAWDSGIIFTASQPLQVLNDRIFIFYSASRHDHNYTQRAPEGTPEWHAEWDEIKTSIGVATLRRDGLVSLTAGAQPGTVMTKAFAWPDAARLHVNADASGGTVEVTVLDEEGQPISGMESHSVRGDQPNAEIKWKGQDLATPSGQMRLRFHIRSTDLYSFWFERVGD